MSEESATAVAEEDQEERGWIKDRYELVRVLGEGAMGRTHLALDHEAGKRKVAIKELLPSRMKRWKDYELFNRECELLEHLNHKGIPKHYEHFTVEARSEDEPASLYLVQEFIDGENLEDLLKDGEEFGEEEVKELLYQTLGVLKYLHGLNPAVIHRDIKPSNLMRRANGEIVLIDFGAVRESVTAEGVGSTVVGTFGYMPPEQYAGQAGPATDLFALGASCVELLTGRPPGELFEGLHTVRLPADLEVTLGMERILMGMTEPDVDRRIQSAQEVLDQLDDEFLMIPRDSVTGTLPIPHEIVAAPRSFPGFQLRDVYLGTSHVTTALVNLGAFLLSLSFPIGLLVALKSPVALIGMVAPMATGAMGLFACQRVLRDIGIYREGRYTLGEVTARFSGIGGGEAHGNLTYRFPGPVGFVHGSVASKDRAFRNLRVGDPLGVIYREEDPTKHVLYAVPTSWSKKQERDDRRLITAE